MYIRFAVSYHALASFDDDIYIYTYIHVHLSSQDVGLWWVDISNKRLLIQNFPPFIVLRTRPRGGDVMGHAISCFMKMVSNLICLRYSDVAKTICICDFARRVRHFVKKIARFSFL